jgi:hypothetical protein
MPTTSDPTGLRTAAEAQLDRLQGPLWASEAAGNGQVPVASTAPSGRRPSGKTKTTVTRTRKPGRPALETPRLPRREVRIPVVVDERAREVAAWGGIEPTEALWLLASLGWESWRSSRAGGVS